MLLVQAGTVSWRETETVAIRVNILKVLRNVNLIYEEGDFTDLSFSVRTGKSHPFSLPVLS